MSETAKPKFTWWSIPLLAGAIVGAWWLYRTGPTVQPTEEKPQPRLVRTVSVSPADHAIRIAAYGSVIPAQRVVIEPEVGGTVTELHPRVIPGGILRRDETLLRIDPRLQELGLAVAQAEVARAEATLEEARRKRDEGLRLATEQVIPDTELASLESLVRIQAAELERLRVRQAREEELLRRHVLQTPFNAVVLEESVEIGQQLDPGDAAITLVGTDEFWVRAALPTDQLRWISQRNEPAARTSAEVILDGGNGLTTRYQGELIQLLSDLEEEGRMARALIRVVDPLGQATQVDREPLLLGSYVRVEIAAGSLANVLAIDRAALREGDRIWVVDPESRLQIRDVTVRWREGETVYIDPALSTNEKLIVSDLRVALPDMVVEAQDAATPTASPATIE